MDQEPKKNTSLAILLAVVVVVAVVGLLMWRGGPTETTDGSEGPVAAGEDERLNLDMLAQGEGLAITAEDVDYHQGVIGRFARPTEGGPYPGVVMIHEWWGLNENIKDMAEALASEGYAVLAVDLFGEVAETPDDARRLTGSLDQDAALMNLEDASAFLRAQGAGRIASLGWCFGGGQSLQLGLADDLDATVIYYGRLETDSDVLSALEQPVLGIFGEDDASISVDQVNAFDAALDDLGVDNEVYIYPGVGHAFANPSGANYAPDETMDAWTKTLEFLAANLR